MVMHARKIPRLEDGYFERSQSHSYDNAVKYNSKGLELYNNKLLHKSPSGSGRNESPSSRPSPHFGHKSYVQRIRDKDRRDSVSSSKSPLNKERTKLNTSSSSSSNPNFSNSRENSFSSSSSSSSKTTENPRTNNSYRTSSNHEQNKVEEKEKRLQVGDWSEHMSSSGKRYYYNCRSEVSQWEKPKEWLDWERHHSGTPKSVDPAKAKFHNYDHHHSSTSLKERHSSSSSSSGLHPARRPSTTQLEDAKRIQVNGTSTDHGEDMDISPDPSARLGAPLQSPSQVSLSDLPKVISQLAGAKALPNFNNLSPQEAIKTIQQALKLTKQVTTLAQSGALKSHCPLPTTTTAATPEPKQQVKVESPPQRKEQSPEATTPKPVPAPNNTRLAEASPTSDTISSRPTSPAATTGSLSSLPGPTGLSPSLAQYYREELRAHVANWQSDQAERQALRLADETLSLSNLVSRVSTELKMARSQVRVAEIQATLQEQRIIFLRQQIRFTEDLRTQKFNEPTS